VAFKVQNCPIFDISFQNGNNKKNYQIHLKSSVGPIYVLLVNKDTDCTSPVAIEVPPPKSVLESSVKVFKVNKSTVFVLPYLHILFL
jgi:hypothetical protein